MTAATSTKPTLNRSKAPHIKDAVDFDLTLKPYTKINLDNGAPVYYINDGAEEVAMVELIFYAGNSFEQKKAIAAATNHLLKNGTSSKNAFEINEYFEYYGAYLSVSAHHETASITLHCLSRHLNELLPVINEIIADSLFPENEIEIFKKNSIQKLSVNLLKCDFVAGRLIDESVYGPHHPYGKIINTEDVNLLTRDDLIAFYTDFYQRANYTIFAAGKLPANFEQLLNAQFGKLPLLKKADIPFYKTNPSAQKKLRIANDANGVQGAIRIARPFFNRHHPDYKKALVLNTLLGGFFGSRLMSNIREDKGYTYGIHSYLERHFADNAWMISTEAGKDVCEAAIEEVYKEMQLLREELVDEEELLLVKNYMMGLNLGDLDGPFPLLAKWKNLILNGLDESYFYDTIHTIKNVTAEELRELANKYLIPEEFFELVVI